MTHGSFKKRQLLSPLKASWTFGITPEPYSKGSLGKDLASAVCPEQMVAWGGMYSTVQKLRPAQSANL